MLDIPRVNEWLKTSARMFMFSKSLSETEIGIILAKF